VIPTARFGVGLLPEQSDWVWSKPLALGPRTEVLAHQALPPKQISPNRVSHRGDREQATQTSPAQSNSTDAPPAARDEQPAELQPPVVDGQAESGWHLASSSVYLTALGVGIRSNCRCKPSAPGDFWNEASRAAGRYGPPELWPKTNRMRKTAEGTIAAQNSLWCPGG